MTLFRASASFAVLLVVALGVACCSSGDSDECPGLQCSVAPNHDSCPDGQHCVTGYLHGPCGGYAICLDGAKPVYLVDGTPCDPAEGGCTLGSTCPCATKVCTAAGAAAGQSCHATADCAYGHLCSGADDAILRDCAGPVGTCM